MSMSMSMSITISISMSMSTSTAVEPLVDAVGVTPVLAALAEEEPAAELEDVRP